MKRVLVVDDDELLRDSLRELLALEGYEVNVAASGEDGLRLADFCWPDVVLCDVMMPGMNGYAFLGRLRTDSGKARPKFVFISALPADNEFAAVYAKPIDADAYLRKPIPKEVLLQTIRQLLLPETPPEGAECA